MVFALILSAWQIIALVCVPIAGWTVVRWLWKLAERREDRKRKYIEISKLAEKMRLPRTAELFTDLAVRDWSGFVQHVRDLRRDLEQPGALMIMLKDNFQWQLAERMRDPVKAAEIQASLPVVKEPAKTPSVVVAA